LYRSDRESQHVKNADESICLGSIAQSGGNPHLNITLLIETALAVNADSVHPGYGYLSENADFAQQTVEAGLIFVGPSARAISVLGDKRAAKEYLTKYAPGIPLIPGYNGPEQEPNVLQELAEKIGYPVLIKASAGGGGKGMRIVHQRENFREELIRAQSEAQSSFGSSQCILERYIQNGKHVEVQIVGDNHGTVRCLFDRDCSVQRRHQKIVEEAPCAWLLPELRTTMCAAATSIGQLLNYESAGTIEFMVDIDSGEFFFLEMNTRIQVEHCITEEITAADIVALQIYVAANGRLAELRPLAEAAIVGHSIECRLCAEDPAKGFLANSGKIWRWTPATTFLRGPDFEDVRFETAMASGSEISVHFDAMIAKVVVWAPTRALALAKMLKVLSHTVCIGITTNQLFLQNCLMHPSFRQSNYTTAFIGDNLDALLNNGYAAQPHDWQQQLGTAASYCYRNLLSATVSRRPFAAVPGRFRNQRNDLGLAQREVISMLTPISPSVPVSESSSHLVVSWRQDSSITKNGQIAQVDTFRTPSSIEDEDERSKTKKKQGAQVAAKYHQLMAGLTSSLTTGQSKFYKVIGASSRTSCRAPEGATFADIDLVLASDKITAYAVAVETSADERSGASPKLYLHVPKLGTFVTFKRQTILEFSASLRGTAEAAASSLTHIKAPMPCKVLKVLKGNGEKVAKGECLVVIESMKTEVQMLAERDGSFEARVKEGEAVGEGTVLCLVE
jgi:acetyl/propionyl-CoA carboxylase alpha subunit